MEKLRNMSKTITATSRSITGNRSRSSIEKVPIEPDEKHIILDVDFIERFQEIFVIGDVHGCAQELDQLIDQVHSTSHTNDPNRILKILVGDLVNKGPASHKVIDIVRLKWKESCLSVRGNHDEIILKVYHGLTDADLPKNQWVKNLSSEDVEFLKNLPYTISLPSLNCIIVHAGLIPIAHDPIEHTPLHMMTRMRNIIVDTNCLDTDLADNVDKITATDSDTLGQGPWAKFWKGPQHIYFGHDAKRRLQQHPFATGLDTGLNYFPLPADSSIYGMTSLDLDDGTYKILVATHSCQIFCIDYVKFQAHCREVEFTYIPSGAKIISIDAFKRPNSKANDFVIGITHSLTAPSQKPTTTNDTPTRMSSTFDTDKNQTYYLNIYASGIYSDSFDLDYIAQGCLTIPIKYVPYHLYHTQLILTEAGNAQKSVEMVWLLSGGDRAVHVFRENKRNQCFIEVNAFEDYFPELVNINGIVLWIDIKYVEKEQNNHQRLCALGLEDGTFTLKHSVYSAKTKNYQLVNTWTNADYLTIIPSVRLFTKKSTISGCKTDDVNLLVVSATEPCLVFHDVIRNGLTKSYELPMSQRIDCNTSATIGDLNCDGYNEIIVGSYGQSIEAFRAKFIIGERAKELRHDDVGLVSIFWFPIPHICLMNIYDALASIPFEIIDFLILQGLDRIRIFFYDVNFYPTISILYSKYCLLHQGTPTSPYDKNNNVQFLTRFNMIVNGGDKNSTTLTGHDLDDDFSVLV
ncbi:KICSTOR complex protein kaptin, partial [Fragariocoptes setiger]